MNPDHHILDIMISFGGGQGGRPGDVAVRFLLAAFFWTVLSYVALREWYRTHDRKDRFIALAAAVGLCRELLMFAAEYGSARGLLAFDAVYPFYPPFEHAATMLSSIIIASAFMNYLLAWDRFSRRYLTAAVSITLLVYLLAAPLWPSFLLRNPGAPFGSFWGDMLFRVAAVVLLGTALAVFLIGRSRGKKVRIPLLLGFLFLFLDEFLMIINLASGERHVAIYAPIRHNLHIWAIPLFLGVYWSDLKDRLHRALTEIRQERLRSEAIIAAIGDAISIQDTDYTILYQNRIDKDLVGERVGELCYRTYENRQTRCGACPVAETLRDGKVHRGERSVRLRSGTRTLEITASPLRDSTGRIIAGIKLVRDVTEKKRLQEEVLKTQKLESIGLLAGGLAHDFNNLLTAIYGNISLAKRSINNPRESSERLDAAERAATRASEVTGQLLTFSKGGAPVKKTTEIAGIVRESVSFTLSGSNVRAEFAVEDGICAVDVDPGQMSQVFNNLALNAVQAMPDGGTLRIAIGKTGPSAPPPPTLRAGEYVRVVVSDAGIGIPEELQSRIFDPYFTTKQKGNGLGLATVYSIVRRHDGLISVESVPGKGAAFSLYLPASKGSVLPVGAPALTAVSGRGSVLIMDDEKAVRETAGAMLTELGYSCSYATDGQEALTLYEQARKADNPFVLVIMDLTIPGGMGGKETVARLLALDPQAAVIVSSGYSNDPVMGDHERHGFKGVIAKPYNMDELGRAVHAALNSSASV